MNGESGRRASLKSYVGVTLCLMGSSSLSNIALNYINYPTKVSLLLGTHSQVLVVLLPYHAMDSDTAIGYNRWYSGA